MSLPQLARTLHTTVDTLLTGESPAAPAASVKKAEELIVRMSILTYDGTRFCLNLPYKVFSLSARYGMLNVTYSAESGDIDAEALVRAMANVDFRTLAELIEHGARGTLVNVADTLTIWTE